MGGRASRQKGMRGEYAFRDAIRRFGYVADRVPCSGAAQGFKGDVRFSKDGKEYTAEVKSRKGSFKTLYALFAEHFAQAQDDKLSIVVEGQLINLSSSPVGALEDCGHYTIAEHLPFYNKHRRTFKRLLKLKELVKGCDLLVVKDNNKPFLFIRYR